MAKRVAKRAGPAQPADPHVPSSVPMGARRDVRSRLLAAADRLFYQEGIRAVGIDRVLAEAGAAKASLYDHFASKDELVAAYLAVRTDQARSALELRLSSVGPDPLARLFALFDAAEHMSADPGFRGCPFSLAQAEYPDALNPAARVCEGQREWVATLIIDLVRQIRPTAPAALGEAIAALYEGGVAQAALGHSSDPVASARWATEQLLDQRLQGA
jgi:AcrR family transcriptional regulator